MDSLMIPAVAPKPPAKVRPFKGVNIRQVALRDLPRSGEVVCRCLHCGLERNEDLAQLVGPGRFGGHTLEQMEGVLTCKRKGCAGPLDMRFEAS